MLVIWGAGIVDLIARSTTAETPWPAALAVSTGAVGIACAGGLWRYHGASIAGAALAGAIVCALIFAGGTAVTVALMRFGISEKVASHWWTATLAAPCALVVLAAFEPAPPRWSVWVGLALLFAAPSAVLALLNDNAKISDTSYSVTLAVISFIWFAAIGYRLQHGPRMSPKPPRN